MRNRKTFAVALATSSAIITLAIAPGVAMAQDTAPAGDDGKAIIVTGSRIKQDPSKSALPLEIIRVDTLQQNDGTLHTKFHPDANRVENGVQTTHNPEFAKIVPVSALGCEAQFRMGNYRYDDRLRGRRFPLVDEVPVGIQAEQESAVLGVVEDGAANAEAAAPAPKTPAPSGGGLGDFLNSREGKQIQKEVVRGVFGLLKSWWMFTDERVDQLDPRISPDSWRRLLLDSGFASALLGAR